MKIMYICITLTTEIKAMETTTTGTASTAHIMVVRQRIKAHGKRKRKHSTNGRIG